MPYRDDREALEARRHELIEERDAIKARLDGFETDLERQRRIAKELAELDARLARSAEQRQRLLDDVKIASPCNVSWDAMQGDERVRFCGQCEKNVYNLSAMSRGEAEALIAEKESSLCVRMFKRADGMLITNDCPVGATKKRRRLKVIAAVSAGVFGSASALALFSHNQGKVAIMGATGVVVEPHVEPPEVPPTYVMGGLVAEPQPQPPPQTTTPATTATTPPPAHIAQPPGHHLMGKVSSAVTR